ncbi:hypothetical protein F9B85_00015 [Heliorestis acidaminivorans]|uniref:Uncharacterized protein n=1 Tax=Heliorestis acidaminivorans TaxID=553427 RepID=A0A6I0F5L5_9FIRM|nr:hypothetical protein [Heliorestis acidaminivorans]KAB2954127.1 hypothetical protein F9B85_00015 [Heliorestis acidaminivorans]
MSSKKNSSMISKIPGFRSGTPWKMGLAGALYVFVLFYAYLIATSSSEINPQDNSPATSEESLAVTTPIQEERPSEPIRTLGITTEEFKSNFNQSAILEFDDLKIDSFAITEGNVQDVVRFPFNNFYEIMGTVNKDDGTLRNISIIGPGGDDLLVFINLLIASTDTSLDKESRQQILDELGLQGSNFNLSTMKSEVVYNDYKYTVSGTKVLGLTFTIQHRYDR